MLEHAQNINPDVHELIAFDLEDRLASEDFKSKNLPLSLKNAFNSLSNLLRELKIASPDDLGSMTTLINALYNVRYNCVSFGFDLEDRYSGVDPCRQERIALYKEIRSFEGIVMKYQKKKEGLAMATLTPSGVETSVFVPNLGLFHALQDELDVCKRCPYKTVQVKEPVIFDSENSSDTSNS